MLDGIDCPLCGGSGCVRPNEVKRMQALTEEEVWLRGFELAIKDPVRNNGGRLAEQLADSLLTAFRERFRKTCPDTD